MRQLNSLWEKQLRINFPPVNMTNYYFGQTSLSIKRLFSFSAIYAYFFLENLYDKYLSCSSMNLVKYVFHREKWNFELTGNFAHAKEFLTWRKALQIFLLLYLQMLIIQILNQTDNHKYRKSVATKKSTLFKKMCLKFPGFYAK